MCAAIETHSQCCLLPRLPPNLIYISHKVMDCGDLGKDLCPLWEKSGRYKVFLWKPKCRVAVTDAGKRHLAQHALPRQPRGDLESELGQQGMREKEVLIWGHA